MNAYLDTSALVRLVLREQGALEGLDSFDAVISSELLAVESRRTIDRLRLQGSLTTEEAAQRLEVLTEWLEFRSPDFEWLASTLRSKSLFDGRNLYDPAAVRAAGLTYYGIGRV